MIQIFIYKITNNINGKVYIGQTIRPVNERFNRHVNDALGGKLNTHFARAIRKYGKDNFFIEVIDTAPTQQILNMKEQYWIRFYDSIKSGYNETDALVKCGGNTYCSKTEAEMEDIKNKIRSTKISGNNPQARKIKCINVDTKEEIFFESIEDCKKYFHEKTSRFIKTRLARQSKSLYKGLWNFAYTEDDYIELSKIQYLPKAKRIVVKGANFIKEYSSISKAATDLCLSYNKLKRALKEKEIQFEDYIITVLN